ncbi:MAG: hypothetical protein IJD30_05650 [Clostridia bacterium]|nr:hypothetical protein [Clostridia bacterium]
MKKALKIIKIILLSLLGLLIVAIIAGVILYQTTFKEPVEKMMSSIDNIIESGELFEPEQEPLSSEIPSPTASGEAPTEEPTAQTSGNSPSPSSPTPTPSQQPQKPKKPATEYKSTYDYVKDNVTPSDFKKGSNFASRVDIGYILGLLSGGLTKSERKELKQYLSERFSQAEINEGIALYKKYSYLLKK